MAIRNTLLVSVAKRVVLLALLTQCSGFSTLSHHRVGVANGADVGRARVASVPTGAVRMAATSGAAAVPRAVATCRRALDLRARMTRSRMPSVTSGTARVLTIRGGAESEDGEVGSSLQISPGGAGSPSLLPKLVGVGLVLGLPLAISMLVPPQAIAAAYMERLSAQPVLTKSVTLFFISMLSDGLAQWLERRKKEKAGVSVPAFDGHRFRTFCTLGALYVAPVCHFWFSFLESLNSPGGVFAQLGLSNAAVALAQMGLDQTLGATVVLSSIYLVNPFFDEALKLRPFSIGEAFATGRAKLRAEFAGTMLMNWRIWPAANFVNFLFVPPALRLLYANVISIFWNAFLASRIYRDAGESK